MGIPKKGEWLCGVAVAALALASLPLALHHMSHSVWYDESMTHLVAHQSTLGGVATLAMKERAYPPLYFVAVHYSLGLRDDEVGLRLPSALFGALTAVAVFLLGAALVDRYTGAVAAFLLVLTPGAFRYFVDGNAYTAFMLASALSTLCLWKAVHSDSTRDWAGYALFAFAGLATHTLFVFHFAAQVLAAVYLRIQHSPDRPRSYRKLALVMGPLLLCGLAWAYLYGFQGGQARPIYFSRLLELSTAVSVLGMLAGPQSFGVLAQLALWGVLLALGAAALYRGARGTLWSMGILIGLPLLTIPVLAKLTRPFVAYRHGLGIFPLVCVIAACSWKLWPRRMLPRAGLAALIIAYCAAGAVFIAGAGENTFGYQDWRSATRYLAGHFRAGDVVVVTGDYGLQPFSYYWKGPPALGCRQAPQAIGDCLAQALTTHEAASARAWVVLSNFANDSPLVAKYTESRRREFDEPDRTLAQALESRGLRFCGTARFQRVTVVETGASSCGKRP